MYITRLEKSGLDFTISDYYSDKKRYINHIRSFDLYVMIVIRRIISHTFGLYESGVLSVSSDAGSKEVSQTIGFGKWVI